MQVLLILSSLNLDLNLDLTTQVVLGKINCQVVSDTLEVLVMHLGKVAEADNRMDVENLGLLFGQVMIDIIQKDFIHSSKCSGTSLA